MTNSERNQSYGLYQGVKVTLNTLADRVFEICDNIIEDTCLLPWSTAQIVLEGAARFVGDMSRLFQEFPRRTAYKLSGAKWTIIYVGEEGSGKSLLEIQHLFFSGEDVMPQEIGRVALWQLSAQCERWWAEGVDLVIGESSRISPYWPQVSFRFSVPREIRQVLDLPDDLESLLSSRRMKDVRRSLKRAQASNFSWYFSKSKEEFDYFYHSMYLPYVKGRHGSRASLSPYGWLRQKLMRGGLIIVTQTKARVGGQLYYIVDKTCFALEGGVLDGNPDLLEQGIRVSCDWFTMNWVHQQGARVYDMGISDSQRSDGVFYYKSRWHSRVARTRRIYGTWNFLAWNVSPELQRHINQIGLISEVKGKFYAAWLSTDQLPLSTTEIDQQLLTAGKQGLDGLLVVSADKQSIIPFDNSTER